MEAQAKGAPELLGNLGNMGALATYRGSNKNSVITAQKTFLMTAPFFFLGTSNALKESWNYMFKLRSNSFTVFSFYEGHGE